MYPVTAMQALPPVEMEAQEPPSESALGATASDEEVCQRHVSSADECYRSQPSPNRL